MNKRYFLVFALALIGLMGCDSGSTSVETVPVEKWAPKKDSMAGAVGSNPNIPASAKNALHAAPK
jgi:hypothetical protein